MAVGVLDAADQLHPTASELSQQASGETPEGAAARLLGEFGGSGVELVGGIEHAYSHFRLDLRLFRARLQASWAVAEGGESRWLTPTDLADWPLHGAHKKALPLV
ncbi:MAG: NUDIX domain-containing protein [Desulfuromonadales bacterium]|nr:NUDIX domain-containing protein [Desulfuromonadales bacterium]